MSNKLLNKKEHQQRQKHFPRVSSWASSLSSFAQHRPQITNSTTTTLSAHHHHHYHYQSIASFLASDQQQHRTRQFIQGPWWSSLYRRITVAPEKQASTKEKKLDSGRNTMVDSTHNHHRQQSSNDHPLAVIPCQRQFNATAVVHGSPLIKSWLRHPFDWVNDARTHAIVQQEEQDQKQLQHVQNDTQSPENTMAGQSPDQCSSISSSSRFSITSTISSASTTTSTCVTFNNDPCCITTASDVDTATTVVSATEEGKHLQKADVVLHRHHTGNSLRLLSVWLVTHLLLQTALCIALTSAWQQETHVTTATTVHEPQQRLHYAKQSKPKHHRQQQQQQQKSRRLAAITDNRGSTALASFAASSGLTVAIPKCWPPLTGSKIISDTVQAMGPPMATLWAEHERSMALYKERFSVRPTERRDHMRKQRRYHYHRHRDNDNDSSSSSSGELEYTRPESQAVMDLARETLEYFEQWYGDHSEQQRAVDDSAEMKTIHWLRQVTVT